MEETERDFLDEMIELSCEQDAEFRADWSVRTLIQSLVERRVQLGLTQQDVAKRMGVARARVAEIECGGATTSFQRIASYADAVGMKLEASKVAEPRATYGGKGRRPGSKRVK
jgi:DNA-binding XRE family transcriptional regulator